MQFKLALLIHKKNKTDKKEYCVQWYSIGRRQTARIRSSGLLQFAMYGMLFQLVHANQAISRHFRDCKALLFLSVTRARNAIASVRPLTF